jgi:hypothetical protein
MGGTASILGIPCTRRVDNVANRTTPDDSVLSSEASASPMRSPVQTAIEVTDDQGAPVTVSASPVRAEQVEPPQVATPVPMVILVTPRRQANMLSCVPATPHGDAIAKYPYYCPLCMEHFQDILETSCCGNYACLPCCMSYAQSKGIDACDINEMLARRSEMCSVACPLCNTAGFCPELVALDNKKIRDYSMAPPVGQNQSFASAYSPVRIGESFEDLKRKMLPLHVGTGNSTNFVTTVGEGVDPLGQSGGIAFPAENVQHVPFSTINSTHEVADAPMLYLSPTLVPVDPAEDESTGPGNLSPTRLLYDGEGSSRPGSLRPTPRSEAVVEAYVHKILLTAVTGNNCCSRMVQVAQ